MPTTNPLKDEWSRVGGPRLGALGTLAETWICPTVDSISPVTDLVAGNLIAFVYQKKVWLRDDTDHTTAHDGVTCIVTNDTIRFKSTGVTGGSVNIWSVLSFTNTPPSTPATGDSYGVGNAPSGVWASNSKAIAIALVGGGSPVWGYVPASAGMIAFDKSQNAYRSVNASTAWVDGMAGIYAAASIGPEILIVPRFVVQSQTITVPVSPSVGQYWLVGAGAGTGAWFGQDNKIAKCTDNASTVVWQFFSPGEGWIVWNVETKHQMVYTSGAWQDLQRPRIVSYPVKLVRITTALASGSATDFVTAPTSATGALVFPEGAALLPTYTLAKATNRLKIQLRLNMRANTPVTTSSTDGITKLIDTAITVAVYKDAQVTADAGNWVNVSRADNHSAFIEFEVSPGDVLPHQWNIRAYGGNDILRAELQFIEVET